ncbi:MAG: hypothetical protein LBQ39_10235 [Tannerellaceae bacterium]|jgi:tetratricopeptide (TPR) repeat protein|nr:hypothetical protein [Tannerellaceae bacterium]
MGNFFTSFFSSSQEADAAEDKLKTDRKNFEIFKYDGIRAQQMHRIDYAIKCYREALSIQEDFETMNYLVTAYCTNHELEEALDVLNPDDLLGAGAYGHVVDPYQSPFYAQ